MSLITVKLTPAEASQIEILVNDNIGQGWYVSPQGHWKDRNTKILEKIQKARSTKLQQPPERPSENTK